MCVIGAFERLAVWYVERRGGSPPSLDNVVAASQMGLLQRGEPYTVRGTQGAWCQVCVCSGVYTPADGSACGCSVGVWVQTARECRVLRVNRDVCV